MNCILTHSSCDDYRAVAVFPVKFKCIRCFTPHRLPPQATRILLNSMLLCSCNSIHISHFALTPPLISDSAYATWMTREAACALQEWSNSNLLTHEHIRAALPKQSDVASGDEHEAGYSTLISKLDDQGWYVFPSHTSSHVTRHTSHSECFRSYSTTRSSCTSHRILSQMCLYDLSMQMHLIEEACSPPYTTYHHVTSFTGGHCCYLWQHCFHHSIIQCYW
jgi:hypothetical protein